MNYLHQIKGFWITQELHQLGVSEIAMYFYLLEIWNRTTWAGRFKRNNYKVMADLSIKSYKTMHSIRDRLQAAGILNYRQKNGDANVEYEMADLSKKYQGSVEGNAENGELSKKYQGSGEGSGKGLVEGSGKGSGEVNINQTKPNNLNGCNGAAPIGATKRSAFTPPTIEQVTDYLREKLDNHHACGAIAESFMNHYQGNGWKVGKNKMADWQATVRNCIRWDTSQALLKTPPPQPTDELAEVDMDEYLGRPAVPLPFKFNGR